ncbi:MAG: HipA domain-containing protein [Bacteroidetes bacterium]|nr:HipA domain-containing protein [Bacteroidota bacterium]
MTTAQKEIFVHAGWTDAKSPALIGVLSAQQGKGRRSFDFEFDHQWLKEQKPFLLDHDLTWHSGKQFPNGKTIFGMFYDAIPDTWGRVLMRRRESVLAREEKRTVRTLHELDFLLGVNDESRMGGLRFKTEQNGNFINADGTHPIPMLSTIRELQHGISLIESEKENNEVRKWLKILLAPGSSLGGARPKTNVMNERGDLWIAKFSSKDDTIDKGAWEFLAYQLALKAGIKMSECRLEKIAGRHHTFFTKRFDRVKQKRIHFASAMAMTGNDESLIKENRPSYLDIAEFIQFNETNNKKELHELWRRMVFNIAISNTDDHLRNHGFLLHENGWQLSPAFDINPSVDKETLALNIDTDSGELDFALAKSVGEYFQLNKASMEKIMSEVDKAVRGWKTVATKIGISRAEQELMVAAFRV